MSRSAFREHVAAHYGELPVPLPGEAVPVPAVPQADVQKDQLPDFKRASQIRPRELKLPPIQVENLLHRGCKMILAGGSKSFKSWVLIDLAVSVAHGLPWWGNHTVKGEVLYLNFELIEGFFEQRIVSVCEAKGVELPFNLIEWNLRAKCYDLSTLTRVIEARSSSLKGVSMIVVDPLYKALGSRDENSARDMNDLMNEVERLAASLDASVVFGSHFSKGNQAGKDAKDRPSGSGVLIRDPDAILTMTRHQDENCMTVSNELRYLPAIPEFVVSWEFPLTRIEEGKDPRRLYRSDVKDKEPDAAPGTTPFSDQDVLSCLPTAGAQDVLWRKHVLARFGKAGNEFYQAKARLMASGLVVKKGLKFYSNVLRLQ